MLGFNSLCSPAMSEVEMWFFCLELAFDSAQADNRKNLRQPSKEQEKQDS